MSWLVLPDDEATPEVARATKSWRQRGVVVPSIVAPMKLAPTVLRAVMQMNAATTFGGSTLGRRREELIATLVSTLNDCFY